MLTGKQKNYLRALAQHRRVIVTLGNAGLTEAVLGEIDQALTRHELLKIRLPAIPRDERKNILTNVAKTLAAEMIQDIGRVGVFYRRSEKPKITFQV
jgi:RNA-binding protein